MLSQPSRQSSSLHRRLVQRGLAAALVVLGAVIPQAAGAQHLAAAPPISGTATAATPISGTVTAATPIAGAATAATPAATPATATAPRQTTAAEDMAAAEAQATGGDRAFAATVAYVTQFYPLWFTYYQSRFASHNRLVGPARVTPVYQTVVAINVDTLYASTFLQLSAQPVVLTLPPTGVRYSILTLDSYGDIFDTGLVAGTPGTYALTGPGYSGTLPAGLTRVAVPYNDSVLIFRADKFSSSGEDQTAEAERFRAALKLQELCDYADTRCPGGAAHSTDGGTTLILPVAAFAVPYKTVADNLIAREPIAFLKQLQAAVAAPSTPPMADDVKALADLFDRLFAGGATHLGDFAAGAQAAHQLILDRYLTNTGATNWITFTNIGDWGDQILDRAAITEFIQYGNGHGTAVYYQAFKDAGGAPLTGKTSPGYVLTFPAGQLPQASRFWSITAYTPNAIELVPNPADKYHVASYDSGLTTNADGSLSIYLAQDAPSGVAAANWLPVPAGAFSIMLRVYGPEGSVATNTYTPPAVQVIQ